MPALLQIVHGGIVKVHELQTSLLRFPAPECKGFVFIERSLWLSEEKAVNFDGPARLLQSILHGLQGKILHNLASPRNCRALPKLAPQNMMHHGV